MKRVWRLSDAAHHSSPRRCSSAKTLTHYTYNTPNSTPTFRFTSDVINNNANNNNNNPCSSSSSSSSSSLSCVIDLFSEQTTLAQKERMVQEASQLSEELVRNEGYSDEIVRVLEQKGSEYIWRYCRDLNPLLELMIQLGSWPGLALEVFDWRRKQADGGAPMMPEEYAKAIICAGKIKNVELAVALFTEAINKGIKSTSMYNALMSAYVLNGLTAKCQSVFRDLKRQQDCIPTVVTYNILISVFGRLMLVDHMEATLQGLKDLNLSPNISTYNNLIAGYITAWMWGSMEETFRAMKASSVSPDTTTYLLMLRGYSYSGNLGKMEEIYDLVKDYVVENQTPLIRAMICAYCKSCARDRLQKVQSLMSLIPKNEYRPWLNVILIRFYAQQDFVEAMEKSIDEAFEHKTTVYTAHVMRCIISTYFRCKDVDRLAHFMKRAECARWRLCRSMYHCKMVMYASEMRLKEMENVLSEMENINLNRTKKTLWILYYAYLSYGQRNKVAQVIGMMWKHGYEVPVNIFPS